MIKLTADEGKTYTNGQTYGKEICLPDGADASAWRMIDDALVPKDGGPLRYSVRKVIAELKAIGKFAAFRHFLETANCDWDFVGANYLAADDADFQLTMASVVAAEILTQEELDALLPKCIWSAE